MADNNTLKINENDVLHYSVIMKQIRLASKKQEPSKGKAAVEAFRALAEASDADKEKHKKKFEDAFADIAAELKIEERGKFLVMFVSAEIESLMLDNKIIRESFDKTNPSAQEAIDQKIALSELRKKREANFKALYAQESEKISEKLKHILSIRSSTLPEHENLKNIYPATAYGNLIAEFAVIENQARQLTAEQHGVLSQLEQDPDLRARFWAMHQGEKKHDDAFDKDFAAAAIALGAPKEALKEIQSQWERKLRLEIEAPERVWTKEEEIRAYNLRIRDRFPDLHAVNDALTRLLIDGETNENEAQRIVGEKKFMDALRVAVKQVGMGTHPDKLDNVALEWQYRRQIEVMKTHFASEEKGDQKAKKKRMLLEFDKKLSLLYKESETAVTPELASGAREKWETAFKNSAHAKGFNEEKINALIRLMDLKAALDLTLQEREERKPEAPVLDEESSLLRKLGWQTDKPLVANRADKAGLGQLPLQKSPAKPVNHPNPLAGKSIV